MSTTNGSNFDLATFDAFENKDEAFDYLCECLESFIECTRNRDRIYVGGTLQPESEYGTDFKYWLAQAFGLDGSITENIIMRDQMYVVHTNTWSIEVQPITRSLTMKLCYKTKVRLGYV